MHLNTGTGMNSFRAVYDSSSENIIQTTGKHDHPPDTESMRRRYFIQSLRQACQENPHMAVRDVYSEEVEKFKQEVQSMYSSWKISFSEYTMF